MSCCRLETERLLLRPPEEADIPSTVVLLGDFDVAKNLARVPHPFTRAHAEDFLRSSIEAHAAGTAFRFSILRKAGEMHIGSIGLSLRDGVFELGYWLGRPYWGQGFATEAARRVAGFAFYNLKATRIVAGRFYDNPASGRVLAKLGAVAAGVEPRDCLARGHAVYCHNVTLARENFGRTRKFAGAA
ncbi:MAG: GNAT family N-acetyltransferase [Alphaproteobacteria bacterium]|nr:GNAT family N-acetyltransferase [Alphaproteobacteria bacterium]MBN9567847.1 GNAT family N-acetyltransferase [Alphaproteobacteria bacterium]MBN9578003.1 GNAT family N-acetyltransferase [Alphaproteobacteria bacterium]